MSWLIEMVEIPRWSLIALAASLAGGLVPLAAAVVRGRIKSRRLPAWAPTPTASDDPTWDRPDRQAEADDGWDFTLGSGAAFTLAPRRVAVIATVRPAPLV